MGLWSRRGLAMLHRLKVFALVEPVAQGVAAPVLRHRLYMVDQRVEGGRVLLKDYSLNPAPIAIESGGMKWLRASIQHRLDPRTGVGGIPSGKLGPWICSSTRSGRYHRSRGAHVQLHIARVLDRSGVEIFINTAP